MPLRIEDVKVDKSYQLPNGIIRKIYEIIPVISSKEIHSRDIVRYEAEKWAYEANRYGGKTRVKVKVREKMHRGDFANEAAKRLD